MTGRPSNWERDVPTRTDYVWLTSAYAVYYAVEAAGEDHEPVIIEVDWDQLPDLYPDEDYIANRRSDGTNKSWNAERAVIDPKHYRAMWTQSLRVSGNLCTHYVSAEAILAHRVIPFAENTMLLLDTGLDAVPTEVNYPWHGDFYRRCLEAYFENELADMPRVVQQFSEEHHREMLGDEGFAEMERIVDKHNLKRGK